VSPSHGLQLFTNCPSVGPSHGSAVLQEQAAPVWDPHGLTSPASRPALAWAPLSMDPQVLPGACSSTGFPWGQSLLQGTSTCSSVGSLPRATGGDLIHRGPPWAAGGQPALPWSSSQAGRQGCLLRHFGHLLPPPSSLTLVSAELFLSHCHIVSLPSIHCHFSCRVFFPFLKYVITEALPPSLIGLALASSGSILEPAGTGFIRHGPFS